MAEKKIEAEIAIDATPEEVWRAISEGEKLKQWFPLDARVTPGEGGKVWLSWGEGAEWESPIEVWKPSKHMRTVDVMPGSEGGPPVRIAVDYVIESRGGQTVVRLVHSGFAEDTWEGEIDSLESGWASFLANLKLYLERHRHETRTVARFRHPPVELERTEAFARVMKSMGLATGAIKVGSRFSATLEGDRLEGVVKVYRPPINFSAVVENWNDAFFMVEIEGGRERCRPAIWVSLYGHEASRASEVSLHVHELLQREFRT
jgi:uncharacterized protein YndB with AHSA1/START domain